MKGTTAKRKKEKGKERERCRVGKFKRETVRGRERGGEGEVDGGTWAFVVFPLHSSVVLKWY
jgi:hypothetical protein